VASLVKQAYITFADGHRNSPSSPRISGGPAWINSDRYMISAKAEGAASTDVMNGPMLQALLESRFKLKTHRETKEIPVYELTGGKGDSKLQPLVAENCVPFDLAKAEAARAAHQKLPAPCHSFFFGKSTERPGLLTLTVHGNSLDGFAKELSRVLDRPIIDKTGITGIFDFRVEFAPDGATPFFRPGGGGARFAGDLGSAANDLVVGPSILSAIEQQLGLKLEPARGPGEFLVIDHVERPAEN
jgi:uncharacterized protein (TIGR03435 family)